MEQRYTTAQVNSNFKMKVYGRDESGKMINKLVGVEGLIKLIGVEFFNKFLDRAFSSMDDKCVCKLRRGLKVSFYYY